MTPPRLVAASSSTSADVNPEQHAAAVDAVVEVFRQATDNRRFAMGSNVTALRLAPPAPRSHPALDRAVTKLAELVESMDRYIVADEIAPPFSVRTWREEVLAVGDEVLRARDES